MLQEDGLAPEEDRLASEEEDGLASEDERLEREAAAREAEEANSSGVVLWKTGGLQVKRD